MLQHRPVEDVIVLLIQGSEQDPEQLAQVHVVRSLFESESTTVVQVHRELSRETCTSGKKGLRQREEQWVSRGV